MRGNGIVLTSGGELTVHSKIPASMRSVVDDVLTADPMRGHGNGVFVDDGDAKIGQALNIAGISVAETRRHGSTPSQEKIRESITK